MGILMSVPDLIRHILSIIAFGESVCTIYIHTFMESSPVDPQISPFFSIVYIISKYTLPVIVILLGFISGVTLCKYRNLSNSLTGRLHERVPFTVNTIAIFVTLGIVVILLCYFWIMPLLPIVLVLSAFIAGYIIIEYIPFLSDVCRVPERMERENVIKHVNRLKHQLIILLFIIIISIVSLMYLWFVPSVIISPLADKGVSDSVTLSGTASIPPGSGLWIAVYANNNRIYYIQNEKPIVSNLYGIWNAPVVIGNSQTPPGSTFDISAIIADDDISDQLVQAYRDPYGVVSLPDGAIIYASIKVEK